MINHIRGIIEEKTSNTVIVDVHGIGYEIYVPSSVLERLSVIGEKVNLYICESTSPYQGNTTLYGFLTKEEREVFILLKDNVPGAGGKKSLEYMDKIIRSMSDFKRAIIEKNLVFLTEILGFSKKTAEKIMIALKDKISIMAFEGDQSVSRLQHSNFYSEAVDGLVALGYRENIAKKVVENILNQNTKLSTVEDIIKMALKNL